MKKRIYTIALILLLVYTSCLNCYAQGTPETTDEIHGTIEEVAKEFNVSANLIRSIVYEESWFVVKENLTQITSKRWFKEGFDYCGSDDISNPYVNIRVLGYYLAKWFRKYGDGDVYLIVEMWNEGEENAFRTHRVNKPSSYAKRVVDRADEWDMELDRRFIYE